MKGRCCRATPRCAGCPVLLAARRRAPGGGAPDLVAEILRGRDPRPLPDSVLRALELLERREPAQPANRSA